MPGAHTGLRGDRLSRSLCGLVALGPFVLALSGCEALQSTFNTHGPAARSISHLSALMCVLFLVLTVIMWALFAIAFYKRRGTLEEHDPISTRGGESWIAIGGILIPLVVLTVLFVWGLSLLRAFPIHGMLGM